MKKFGFLLFSLLWLCISSLAQGLGSIVGTVTDPSGAILPGARITAVQVDTGLPRTTAANDQGYFVLSSLKPAEYAISIESPGFRITKQTVTLLADQALTVNAHMVLGAPSEVVEVSESQVQVDTSTSTLRQVVEQTRLTELPLNGRNAATLTLTTAGSVQAPSSAADQRQGTRPTQAEPIWGHNWRPDHQKHRLFFRILPGHSPSQFRIAQSNHGAERST